MLRRLALTAALTAALLSPTAGLAQAAGVVNVTPGTFGLASCSSTDLVGIRWTSSAATFAATDFYRVEVSNTPSCPISNGNSIITGVLVDNLTVTGLSQTLPLANSVTPLDLLAYAGINTCTVADTLYICVQQWPVGGGGTTATPLGSASAIVKIEIYYPPVPVSVTVAPGDSALYVSWTPGTVTSTNVAADHYTVTATAQTNSFGGATANFTGTTNNRLGGLFNGNTYDVTVVAVSAGGNISAPSSPKVPGTPMPVSSFWDIYKADGGREQGGCGGGPAGLVSILGVALGLRLARRRS